MTSLLTFVQLMLYLIFPSTRSPELILTLDLRMKQTHNNKRYEATSMDVLKVT